ncbi:MAG: methylenetetrahydrofolate reductase C-terminal domain-containing protein [Endomicrobium sp.]|jgi:hypothetical protein|nr:methylenetetrahydrofolate reductase C-terminal domain-containing protein [Endomicrobium sp.]
MNIEKEEEKYSKMFCSKGFVNGPCGSVVDGKCEVDHMKNCVWVLIYKKLEKKGKLQDFIDYYIPPKKLKGK